METIALEDKLLIEKAKYNKDISMLQAKLYEAEHNNVILKLAVKYKLQEGDTIEEDTRITRKPSIDQQ